MVGFRLFLRVEVVEVPEKFIETVIGGQILVQVAEVVLAELGGHITVRFEQLGQGGVLFAEA